MSRDAAVSSIFIDPVESILFKYMEREEGDAREEFKDMLELYREKLISIKVINGRILVSPFCID